VRKFRILLAFACLAGPLMCGRPAVAGQDSSQTGDPVADAARKAREQKKTSPKPKKVFTDDDVATRPAPEATAPPNLSEGKEPPPPTADTAAGGGDSTAQQKEDTHSEKYWRKRFAALRKKIADTQEELDVLQREADKAGVQYYSDPQKALKEQYTREEINAKNEKIAEKRKELDDLKQRLSDLEDELRRSGGAPGWAR
jgi:predicted RNase H-like nuclease (RuvC/YqgF family)